MHAKLRPSCYEEFLASFCLDVPDSFTFVYDVLDVVAAQEPSRLAMIHVDDAGHAKEYTFAFFAEESSRIAHALAAQGIGRGDKVMLILHRRVEFWTVMLALHRLGAVAVPSPALLTSKDIEYRVNFAGIAGVVVDNEVMRTVDAAKPHCPSLRVLVVADDEDITAPWQSLPALIAGQAPDFPRTPETACGEDPLLIFFSSGTTGQPKMVLHSCTYPLGHLLTGAYWHDIEPGAIHLTVADTGWGKAVWGKFYGQWMAGGIVFVWDYRGKFEPARLLEMLSTYRVTNFCAPPTIYRFLIREDLAAYDLSALRHCTTAGELLNESVAEAWHAHFGLSLYEGYGQTETTLQIATFPFMPCKPGSIGRPCPGWDVVLRDEKGELCPPGVEGEICVRIDAKHPTGLFQNYLQDEKKTAEAMCNGYYHTGDKAWMDEDGYFWFLGRVDDLIKSSGYRIGPFEVESALVAHDAVIEAAVTGVPDAVRGQAVKATVVLAPGYSPSEELTRELQAFVKKTTAPYKYPRSIEYVAELPKTISGKIKRAEIRSRDCAAS